MPRSIRVEVPYDDNRLIANLAFVFNNTSNTSCTINAVVICVFALLHDVQDIFLRYGMPV